MTRITQISTATLLAIFASTAFVATADARAAKERCKQTSLFSIFRTACETPRTRYIRRIKPPTYVPPPNPETHVLYNFRSRTDAELGDPTRNGGNSSDGGGRGGKGGNGNGGAAGGQP